jgi:hypothetical protein
MKRRIGKMENKKLLAEGVYGNEKEFDTEADEINEEDEDIEGIVGLDMHLDED